MAKMTSSYLQDYTNKAICRDMEYVKQKRRQGQQTPNVNILQQTQLSFTDQLQTASQPAAMQYNPLPAAPQLAVANKLRPKTLTAESRQSRMTTDYIMARNLASSNPPSDVLQQHGRYQWTEFQPGNLQSVLPCQLQPMTYSTQILSGSQPPNTATSSYETMVPEPSFNSTLN